ncbi:MAG: DNA repair protein RecO [Hydrogenophilus sp.]|nr:DNA repair protein RecO [Hydrogenophilus sp.]
MGGTRRSGAARGFVLHSVPWRESSLLVDAFTAEGRLWLAAKGARRPASALRSVLLRFQPLWLRWSGRGEVLTLTGADWLGGIAPLQGEALWCGYYLNELVRLLAPREVPCPEWFQAYEEAVQALAAGKRAAPVLRAFEWATLKASGYAPLPEDAAGLGPAPLSKRARTAIEEGAWEDEVVAGEVREWLRTALERLLEGRPLRTRQFMREWRELGG